MHYIPCRNHWIKMGSYNHLKLNHLFWVYVVKWMGLIFPHGGYHPRRTNYLQTAGNRHLLLGFLIRLIALLFSLGIKQRTYMLLRGMLFFLLIWFNFVVLNSRHICNKVFLTACWQEEFGHFIFERQKTI